MSSTSDFILWSPRELNTVADHAVNASLDQRRSWSSPEETNLQRDTLKGANFRLCVDGGLRSGHAGAMGMALYVATKVPGGPFQYEVVLRKGELLQGCSSAFQAEAMGLEWALNCFLGLGLQHRQA